MVAKIPPQDSGTVLKFGGGLHTRASPDEIDDREAAGGFNFLIDIDNRNLRCRPPFDLIGTVPNAAPIRGAGSLLKTDGTVTTFFQAGNTVYKWTPPATFSSVGTVSANAKLRGNWKTHVFNLTDELIVTDLDLIDPVYKWDGTALSAVVFKDQGGGAFGPFFARYCSVMNERVMFANVKAGIPLPHMIVASLQSDYTKITTVNRPSNAIGTGDPWFLLSPDLKPVNGFLATYRGTMISTQAGEIFALSGTDSTNFAWTSFFANSAATGQESPEETGNDFIYGRQGRIESVSDTQNYGNSEASDLTAIISDQIATYTSWTNVFNSRTRKLYSFPAGISEVWVLDVATMGLQQQSPWMRWRTSHNMAFEPTTVMSLLDPSDGLEYIFMGDSSGNIYRMEGTGTNGDGGTNSIDMQFLSKLFTAQLDAECYDVEGVVKYQAQTAPVDLNITFKYQGYNIFNKAITTSLRAASGGSYYGAAYYNDAAYYNAVSGQIFANRYVIPGHAGDYQVLVEATSVNPISINQIIIRLRQASS